MEVLVILVLLIVIIGSGIVSIQRKLVVMDENINNAMNQIGVQISSRFDALIALLEVVENYETLDASLWLEKVKSNRKDIHAKSMPGEASVQEHIIVEALRFIDGVVRQYPEIKENKAYQKRMGAVDAYERMLYTSHLIYNDSVRKLNQSIRMFPTSWIAGMLGFHEREHFETV